MVSGIGTCILRFRRGLNAPQEPFPDLSLLVIRSTANRHHVCCGLALSKAVADLSNRTGHRIDREGGPVPAGADLALRPPHWLAVRVNAVHILVVRLDAGAHLALIF